MALKELEPQVTTCARAVLTRATRASHYSVVGVKHLVRAYVQKMDTAVGQILIEKAKLTEDQVKAHMPSRRRSSQDDWVVIFGVTCDFETANLLYDAYRRACETYPPAGRLSSGFLFETMVLKEVPALMTLLQLQWIDRRRLLALVAQPQPKVG